MAKTFEVAAFLATALCLSSLLGFVHCSGSGEKFFVEGKVYCDTCRVQFETRLTENLPGATVGLECREREGGRLTYSNEGVTDQTGNYKLPVEGDHEEEICEVKVLKSTNPDCNEFMVGRDRARILLTKNNGAATADRFANSLGFMKKEALPNCGEVLRELGFVPFEI